MADPSPYLTTRELADLLRVKERKVYELAAASDVPFTRVTGKLLFPRHLIEAWLARHTEVSGDLVALPDPPAIAAGSHDPLLDWALRESRCGIATFFDGSLDGLDRFARREALFCGLHMVEADSNETGGDETGGGGSGGYQWNTAQVASRYPLMPVVLVEWAWRDRGLIVAPGNPLAITTVASLKGKRFVPRQATAGTQMLFASLLRDAGLQDGDMRMTAPARTEQEVATAVRNGKADAALGIACVAREYGLGFVPLVRERFDLLVWRRSWFEAPMQSLVTFCRSEAFRDRAADLGGYDVSGNGTVHYNGP